MTDYALAHAELDALLADQSRERAVASAGTECWLCRGKLVSCRREGCPRVWTLKPGPVLATNSK